MLKFQNDIRCSPKNWTNFNLKPADISISTGPGCPCKEAATARPAAQASDPAATSPGHDGQGQSEGEGK